MTIEYTIKELAELAGVTTRTLRYYDQIDLLKPSYLTAADYRIYSQREVDQLHQILLLRELSLSLAQIKAILTDPETETLSLLHHHQQVLQQKQARLTGILAHVAQTIAEYKGELTMTNEEKFTALKRTVVAENEARHGQEVREQYGAETIEAANQKMLNLSEEAYGEFQQLEGDIITAL